MGHPPRSQSPTTTAPPTPIDPPPRATSGKTPPHQTTIPPPPHPPTHHQPHHPTDSRMSGFRCSCPLFGHVLTGGLPVPHHRGYTYLGALQCSVSVRRGLCLDSVLDRCLDIRLWCLDMKGHRTRDRADRRQVNVILDAGLVTEAKRLAVDRGVSFTQLVAEALEVTVYGHVGVGSDGGVVSAASGDGVGQEHGRDRERGVVSDAVGRGVDWDAVLAAGRRAKRPEVDPLVEIA